jgi:hypothetical protein
MFDERALKEDGEWVRMVFGDGADGGSVPRMDRCIYCAGEWYRKV